MPPRFIIRFALRPFQIPMAFLVIAEGVKQRDGISVFSEIFDAYGIEANGLKSFMQDLANGAEIGAGGKGIDGAADTCVVSDDLATPRDRMKQLRKLSVVELLHSEANGDS